jgi:hypothetical protein
MTVPDFQNWETMIAAPAEARAAIKSVWSERLSPPPA